MNNIGMDRELLDEDTFWALIERGWSLYDPTGAVRKAILGLGDWPPDSTKKGLRKFARVLAKDVLAKGCSKEQYVAFVVRFDRCMYELDGKGPTDAIKVWRMDMDQAFEMCAATVLLGREMFDAAMHNIYAIYREWGPFKAHEAFDAYFVRTFGESLPSDIVDPDACSSAFEWHLEVVDEAAVRAAAAERRLGYEAKAKEATERLYARLAAVVTDPRVVAAIRSAGVYESYVERIIGALDAQSAPSALSP